MRSVFAGALLWAVLPADGLAAETPQTIAARDYAYCAAWYTLAASSSSTDERKKARTDWAIVLGQYSTILSDAAFFTSAYKEAHARILRDLTTDSAPGNTAKRAVDVCSSTHEKNRSLVLARINEINELAKQKLR